MPKQILVVDDEEDVASFLCGLLRDNGYATRSARDGREALEAIRECRPDLVLLDLMMPYETGTGLFRKLRHTKALETIPVIIVSGLAGRRVAVPPSVPMVDKPVDEQRLIDEVRRALGG